MRRTRVFLALFLAAPVVLEAQGVLVAPHAIFIDHRTRSGSLELYNPNSQPAEVTISTLFGYPVTDSLGIVTLKTTPAPDSGQPSAAAWIEAYPRRLILRPLERQRVRLLARPPAGLPDGEYWTRLIVAARGGSIPVAGVPDTTSIRIGLTVEMRTIIAVFYRKGAVRTGIALSDVRAEVVRDSLIVRARLTRQGNAAYLGQLRGTLLDQDGRQVATFASQLGVYYELEPRFVAAVGRLRPARYTVQLEVTTDRTDLPRNGPIRASPVNGSAAVTVARSP
jgi:P pilus assembly chaperone PapD